jgi:hypothetical protein
VFHIILMPLKNLGRSNLGVEEGVEGEERERRGKERKERREEGEKSYHLQWIGPRPT